MPANVETMFYTREKPWHGLGTEVQEAPTSADALICAGLDWAVEQKAVFTGDGSPIPGYKANTRSTDNTILGIVSDRYKVVQNSDAFQFTDDLLGAGVTYETAGSLQGGRKVWLLARMPHRYIIAGDEIAPYLVVMNSHDGSSGIKVAMTPVRVVCQNTLNLALNSAKRIWTTKHTENVMLRVHEAEETLGLAEKYMGELGRGIDTLSNIRLSDKKVMELTAALPSKRRGKWMENMDNTKLKSRMGGKVKELQKPMETAAEPAPDTALTPANSGYLALTGSALDLIRDNLKHQPLSLDLFDVVKSPSGGSTVFEVPGLAGTEAEKELFGIILDYTTPRAYWDTPDPVEGTPPVCMSPNSIVSQNGESCTHCPFNDFGSKDGESNAKACKESVLLFLLRPQSIIPLLVRVPVTSKPRFLKYATRLLSTLTPLSSVVTKITLEKATSKGGKPYALFNFEAVSVLGPEEAANAKAYACQFMELVNAAELTPELAATG